MQIEGYQFVDAATSVVTHPIECKWDAANSRYISTGQIGAVLGLMIEQSEGATIGFSVQRNLRSAEYIAALA